MQPGTLDWWFFGGVLGVLVTAFVLSLVWLRRTQEKRATPVVVAVVTGALSLSWMGFTVLATLLTAMGPLD